jgi:hypothetical protein
LLNAFDNIGTHLNSRCQNSLARLLAQIARQPPQFAL